MTRLKKRTNGTKRTGEKREKTKLTTSSFGGITVTKTKQAVILEGFLLDCNSPDAESLTITVDCTALLGDRYLQLIGELEDLLSEMDIVYAKREVRGRSLKGAYRRHLLEDAVQRTRRLTFIPYPGKVVNVPGNLRRSLYYEINRRCIILQRQKIGRKHRVVYLLPFDKAPDMMLFVDGLNKEIADVNKELERLSETEVPKVLAILDRYGVDGHVYAFHDLHKFSINPRPVRLDPNIIDNIVEERYRIHLSQLSEEERRGFELLREELESQRVTLVREAVANLTTQINYVASQLLGAIKRKPERAKQELRRIAELADSAGLSAIRVNVISPLLSAVDNPEKASELLGSKDLVEGVNLRARALIESL